MLQSIVEYLKVAKQLEELSKQGDKLRSQLNSLRDPASIELRDLEELLLGTTPEGSAHTILIDDPQAESPPNIDRTTQWLSQTIAMRGKTSWLPPDAPVETPVAKDRIWIAHIGDAYHLKVEGHNVARDTDASEVVEDLLKSVDDRSIYGGTKEFSVSPSLANFLADPANSPDELLELLYCGRSQ